MKLFGLLILAVFALEKKENGAENGQKHGEGYENNKKTFIIVKIEEDEYTKVSKKSKFIGVVRSSKHEKKLVYNGSYNNEKTAAHASDTLARKLMENGEQGHKLNFPDDDTEVYSEIKIFTSKFIGVFYDKSKAKWRACRWSNHENKPVHNGSYGNEETAAHASDTLARKLMKNGEQSHKLNFFGDYTKVYPEKKNTSKFIGVSFNKQTSKWTVQRRSKHENKMVHNKCYDNEETAAHASDNLAKKLIENGEQGHKMNFPYDEKLHTEETQNK